MNCEKCNKVIPTLQDAYSRDAKIVCKSCDKAKPFGFFAAFSLFVIFAGLSGLGVGMLLENSEIGGVGIIVAFAGLLCIVLIGIAKVIKWIFF